MLTRSAACTFDFSLYFISFPLDVIQACISKVLKLLSLAFPHFCTWSEKLFKNQNFYNFTFLSFFTLQHIIIWLTFVILMKLYSRIISNFSLWVEDVLQSFLLWLSLTSIPADYSLPGKPVLCKFRSSPYSLMSLSLSSDSMLGLLFSLSLMIKITSTVILYDNVTHFCLLNSNISTNMHLY